MVRLGLAAVFLAGLGCGKQLNPDFCDAHPSDDRCLGGTVDVRGDSMPLDALTGCPLDYTVTLTGSSSVYRVVDTSVLWPAAQTDCGGDGATTHLIVINNNTERQALAPHVANFERHVGYTDEVNEGTWIPVTDDPAIYADLASFAQPPWNGGEPNQGTSGNCMAISNDLTLRDRTCDSEPAGYICECDAYAPDPANF